jgi:hypothetical protein
MRRRRFAFLVLFAAAGCTAPLTVAEPRDAGPFVNGDGSVDGNGDADPPLLAPDAAGADARLDANDEPDPISDPPEDAGDAADGGDSG